MVPIDFEVVLLKVTVTFNIVTVGEVIPIGCEVHWSKVKVTVTINNDK